MEISNKVTFQNVGKSDTVTKSWIVFLILHFPHLYKALPLSERLQNLDNEEYYFAFKVWVRVLCCAVPLTILWKRWPVPERFHIEEKRYNSNTLLLLNLFLVTWVFNLTLNFFRTFNLLKPIPVPELETDDERLIMLREEKINYFLFLQRKGVGGWILSFLTFFINIYKIVI